MLFIIEGQVRRFFLGRIASGEIGLSEAGQEKQQNRQLVYGGGALFHMILDAELTARHGAGAYEALLRDLYENSHTGWSLETLLAFLDERSEGSASEIYSFLNAPFDYQAVLDRMSGYGLSVAAFGPDEILVRYEANGCSGSREAACMPAYFTQ